MWVLNNRTPYAAERTWTRDKTGTHHWLVAVKATFDILPGGQLKLADEQPPPLLAPEYRGDPTASSLRIDSDLLAVKPTTDVVLDATAHAPGGVATKSVPVALRVGSIEKTLVVHGSRVYYKGAVGMTMSTPVPFVTHPIHYEWAFGGTDLADEDPRKHRMDLRNPVGRGIAAAPGRLEHQPAHAVEYPNSNPAKRGPAGFGPIASFWSPRAERAGTYDHRWEQTKKPLLAEDYDPLHANSSPDDQRSDRPLRGGETVTLVNMTPAGAMRFDLPKIYLTFRTRLPGRMEDHRAILTSVFIVPDRSTVSLVWQSALSVRSRELEYLDSTIIDEKPYI